MRGRWRWVLLACVALLLLWRAMPWTTTGLSSARPQANQTSPTSPSKDASEAAETPHHPIARHSMQRLRESDAWAACDAAWKSQMQVLRSELDPAADPDTAIKHALLGQWTGWALQPQSRLDVASDIQRSREHWPDNVELAWLALDACEEPDLCKRALAEVQRLDGHNLATWLKMLAVTDGNDGASLERTIARAAESTFFDNRFGSRYLRLEPLLRKRPPPSACLDPFVLDSIGDMLGRHPDANDVQAMAALEAELANPALVMPMAQLARTCKNAITSDTHDPLAQQGCTTVLERLAESDVLAERSVALRLLSDAGDPQLSGHAREAYRQLLWMADARQRGLRLDPAEFLRLGEQGATEAALRRSGRWPPPAHWLPDDPELRVIVTPRPR